MYIKFKSMICVFATALFVIALTACSPSGMQEKTLDTQKLADNILSNVKFNDELVQVPDALVDVFYSFDSENIAEIIAYVSSTSATAEEFTIVTASDAKHVENIKAVLQKRVDDQLAIYESYSPIEVKKLKDAQIISNGKYVLLVIADDPSGVSKLFKEAE